MTRQVVEVKYHNGEYNTYKLDEWLNKGYNIINTATPHVSTSTGSQYTPKEIHGSVIYVLEKAD